MRCLILIIISLQMLGCASLSNRSKSVLTSVGVGLVAGTAGAILAPKDEKESAHFFAWGASATAISAITTQFIFDEKKRSDELQRQNEVLRKEIDAIRLSDSNPSTPVFEASSNEGKDFPDEVKNMLQKGKWQLFHLNRWRPAGENVLIHEDKMFKLIPPKLVIPN